MSIQNRPWTCICIFLNLPNQPRPLGPKAKSSLFVWKADWLSAFIACAWIPASLTAVLNYRHNSKLRSQSHKATALILWIHTCIYSYREKCVLKSREVTELNTLLQQKPDTSPCTVQWLSQCFPTGINRTVPAARTSPRRVCYNNWFKSV